MPRELKKEIVWKAFDSQSGLYPDQNKTYLIFGRHVNEGRMERTIRMGYWSTSGHKWLGSNEVAVEMYAELNFPV